MEWISVVHHFYEAFVNSFAQPNVVWFGCLCMGSQILWSLLFKYALPKGPWSVHPVYTAHQFTTTPLMTYMGVVGIQKWFLEPICDASSDSNALVFNVIDETTHLSQLVVGAMLFWDIPIALLSSEIGGGIIMQVHHVGLWGIAAITLGVFSPSGTPVLGCYIPFFMGVIEFSSIPLTFIDMFDEKNHPEWHDYMKKSSVLSAFHEACKALFVVSFLVIRGYCFPMLIFADIIPNIMSILEDSDDMKLSLQLAMGLGVAFSLLQWYWVGLILIELAKLVMGDKKQKTN